MRRLTCNNSIAYLKNWTDNFFQIFFMGTSWVAVSINNITTRASREMTSRKNINIFDFNEVNVAKHWYVAGEVFAISDCLVCSCLVHYGKCFHILVFLKRQLEIIWIVRHVSPLMLRVVVAYHTSIWHVCTWTFCLTWFQMFHA